MSNKKNQSSPAETHRGPDAARILGMQALDAVLQRLQLLDRVRREIENEWEHSDDWIDYTLMMMTRDVQEWVTRTSEIDELTTQLYTWGTIAHRLGELYTARDATPFGRLLSSLGEVLGAYGELIEITNGFERA